MSEKKNLKISVFVGLFWKFAESACADVVSFIVDVYKRQEEDKDIIQCLKISNT